MFRHHHVYLQVTIFSLFPRFLFVYCLLLCPFCCSPYSKLGSSFVAGIFFSCYLSASSVPGHIYIQ